MSYTNTFQTLGHEKFLDLYGYQEIIPTFRKMKPCGSQKIFFEE